MSAISKTQPWPPGGLPTHPRNLWLQELVAIHTLPGHGHRPALRRLARRQVFLHRLRIPARRTFDLDGIINKEKRRVDFFGDVEL
jgi:hypothetical protein